MSAFAYGADASPTLAETTAWLKEKLSVSAGGMYSPAKMTVEERYKDFSFEGCSLMYTSSLTMNTPGVPRSVESMSLSVPLNLIDPSKVTAKNNEK
jgi:hypothetical protein